MYGTPGKKRKPLEDRFASSDGDTSIAESESRADIPDLDSVLLGKYPTMGDVHTDFYKFANK